LERLLGESQGRAKSQSQPVDIEAEAEAAALYQMSRRLRRLRARRAPERLRRSAWTRAMAVPVRSQRSRRLWVLDPAPTWFQAAARVAATIVAVATVGYGAVAASASTLPGSPLYPVKVLVEDITIAVAPEDQKPDLFVNQANRRLDEAEALARDRRIDEAERLAEDATRSLESAKVATAKSPDPIRVSQAIETTENRLERARPAPAPPRVSVTRPVEIFPVPVAPSAIEPTEESIPTAEADEPAPTRVEALRSWPVPPHLAPAAASAPVISGGPPPASGANAINPGRVAAPGSGLAPMVQIESTDASATAPSPTRGAVSAPQGTVITVLDAAATPTRTPEASRTPTRTAVPQTTPSSGNSSSAPTNGFMVLPGSGTGTPSATSESDASRSPR
jgi:hypothetical protein